MTVRVARDAIAELQHHVNNPQFVGRAFNYDSHIDEMDAVAHMAIGDGRYLAAAAAKAPADREKLLGEAAEAYQKAIGAYQLIVLRYYTDDALVPVAFPKDVNRANVHKATTRQQQDEIMNRVRQELAKLDPRMMAEEYVEYETYIARATTRLGQLLRR
jgi:hypothetical protein